MNTKKRSGIREGTRVGRLVVRGKTDERKNGYSVWRCTCDCGGEILLDTRCLQRGTVTDCGCISNVRPGQKDLSGQRFGRLVCVAPTDGRASNGAMVWRCRCDCGEECLAASTQLTKGYKKSCGCMSSAATEDITGRIFGQLTVIGRAGRKNGTSYWRCRCACGQETVARYTYLMSGHTKSCGCLQRAAFRQNLQLVDGTSVAMLESGKKRTIASNTSGYTGVYLNRRTGKWSAQITFKGKTHYLGSFADKQDAIRARRRGEEMHDDFLERYYEKKRETEDTAQ